MELKLFNRSHSCQSAYKKYEGIEAIDKEITHKITKKHGKNSDNNIVNSFIRPFDQIKQAFCTLQNVDLDPPSNYL